MNVKLPYQRNKFVRGTIHADTADPDKFTLQTTEEVSRLIDYCRQREESQRFAQRDGLVHVAEIPVSVWERAVREGWDNADGWRRWLNDPDNQCFRTWKGRV